LEHLSPSELYHSSFRPHSILQAQWKGIEDASGIAEAKLQWWKQHQDDCPQEIKWKDGTNRHLTRKEVFQQIRQWPGTGRFLAKNAFQILRRHVHHGDKKGQPHAASVKLAWPEQYSETGPGTRIALNLLSSCRGGRKFLVSHDGDDVADFFAAALRDAWIAWPKAVRDIAKIAKTEACRKRVEALLQDEDVVSFGFRLCELQKIASFVADEQAERYLRTATSSKPHSGGRKRAACTSQSSQARKNPKPETLSPKL
jgi:hypothetical protein